MGKRKLLSLLLSVLIVTQTILVPISYADENVTPTPEQTSPSPEPTPSGAVTETGDAQSQATTNNDVNNTNIETTGTVVTDGCSVDGSIDCTPNIDNTATTEGTTDSESTSGGNTIDGANNALIDTGTATSSAELTQEINTTTINATEEGTLEDSEGTPTPSPEPIEISNSATSTQTTNAESTSGENTITDTDRTATIITDTAAATANQVNIVNTTMVGSDIDFLLQNIMNNTTTTITLNDIWNQLLSSSPNQDITGILPFFFDNYANLQLTATATAVSGNNTIADTRNGAIFTGDAYASANIFNLINLNILGSQFFIGVINIFADLNGDIVLPNMDRFNELATQMTSAQGNLSINNSGAILNNTVSAGADSGNNTQVGGTMQGAYTGDALASATNTNIANTNIFNSNWFMLLINNFGLWNGQILGFNDPTNILTQQQGVGQYENQSLTDLGQVDELSHSQETSGIENTATISSYVDAQAISGGNSILDAKKKSLIDTGRAVALANLFNFINTNIVGSRFFLPIINIFGTWNGNAVFAYPDLNVSLQANASEVSYGDNITYTVAYHNSGYEEARNANINIALPQEETVVSSSTSYSGSGSSLSFAIGTVASGASNSFTFTTQVIHSSAKAPSVLSMIGRLFVGNVEAAENMQALTTTAVISSQDRETDSGNNSFSITKYLDESPDESNTTTETTSTTLPYLTVTSSHNVATYVYPGDTITFFVTVNNAADAGTAINPVLEQYIYDADGNLVSVNTWKLNNIGSGGNRKVTFGLQVPKAIGEGLFASVFIAHADSDSGETVYSNESSNDFSVKGNVGHVGHAVVPEVMAADRGTAILGAKTQNVCKNAVNWFPYMLLSLFATLWVIESQRRRNVLRKLEELSQMK